MSVKLESKSLVCVTTFVEITITENYFYNGAKKYVNSMMGDNVNATNHHVSKGCIRVKPASHIKELHYKLCYKMLLLA